MKAVMRLAMGIAAVGLMLAGPPARAQDASPETNATDTNQIGPRELQNFNLQGTVTRPADPRPTPNATTSRPAERAATPQPAPDRPETDSQVRAPTAAETGERAASRSEQQVREAAPPSISSAAAGAPSVTTQLPPIGDSPSAPISAGAADFAAPADDGGGVPLPWIFAALALLGGAGFYFWRNRQREAYAGVPDHVRPEPVRREPVRPEPAPRPAPLPRAAQPAAAPRVPPAPQAPQAPKAPEADPIGLVSTRMRPWLEIAFQPISCAVDQDNFIIEFELGLFNSGNSPARAILVEASYFNAGPTQDQEIERFFANPVGEGGRATSLGPLKRMVIRNRIVTPRASVREFEVGGRKVFVPLIAFNALYNWSNGEGQSSSSFMLGRKTGSDKLAPFRLDMVGRQFTSVGKRPLPTELRH